MSSVGAAKLAAIGLGIDSIQFAQKAIGSVRVFRPDMAASQQYEALYQQYTSLYKSEE